jgi:bifunctional ADP-heptose synthase (sugar kinase/adenylyltransferase)
MFMASMPQADIVLLSDYGKGALVNVRAMITHAKSAGKTVLVDPKGYDYYRYQCADLVKPNKDEMKEFIGGWGSEDELEQTRRKAPQEVRPRRGASHAGRRKA